MIKIDGKNKNIIIDNKNYVITTKYNDSEYGEILKAVTTKIKDFEKIYFFKSDKEYVKIEDEKILKYLKEKYEYIESDVVFE